MTTDGVNTSLLYRPTEEDAVAHGGHLRLQGAREPLHLHLRQPGALRLLQRRAGPGGDLRVRPGDREGGQPGLRAPRGGREPPALLAGSGKQADRRGVRDRPAAHTTSSTSSASGSSDSSTSGSPDTENLLVSHSRDETKYVVHSGIDRTLGSYHLLDAEPMELTQLFDISPWLDERRWRRWSRFATTAATA